MLEALAEVQVEDSPRTWDLRYLSKSVIFDIEV
jgi:hypothetical protein